MKKKKKMNTLVLLFVLLLILIAAYILLREHNQAATEAESSAESTASEALLSLGGQISEISYSYGEDVIDLKRNEDGDWYRADQTDFALKQSTVKSMVSSLSGALIKKDIGASASLDVSEYGLDEARTITVRSDAGGEAVLLLGDTNSMSGGIYAMLQDQNEIVLTDSALATAFNYGWDDLYDSSAEESSETEDNTETSEAENNPVSEAEQSSASGAVSGIEETAGSEESTTAETGQ